MKRVILLVVTNIAVMLVLSIVVSVLGLDRWLAAEGINYGALLRPPNLGRLSERRLRVGAARPVVSPPSSPHCVDWSGAHRSSGR